VVLVQERSYSLVVNNNQKRIEFLLALHEMAGGDLHQGVLDNELAEKLGLETEEFRRHALYLKEEGLVKFRTFSSISISHEGRKEAERIMAESYAERETRVLKKIYEMRQQNTTRSVFFPQLEPAVGMNWHELSGLLKGLEELGYVVWPGGDVIHITREGIEAIDSLNRPKPKTGGDTYNTHITNLQGTAHVGPGGSHDTHFNQPISEIIPDLTALIEAVRKEDFDTKDDVVHDLEIAHQVALANPNATAKDGAWTRIQTKLTAAKTTMELAGFVVKTYPYWPQVWDFITRHVQ
jgi:Mn-dependent DtxR family transcriptional regulator